MDEGRTYFRMLDCGHYYPVSAPAITECPFCEDYREAFELDALDALLDDSPSSVVPHTRD